MGLEACGTSHRWAWTASALVPPCQIDDPRQLAATHQLQAWTPFNVTGHPAVSVMTGLSRSGLPLSMHWPRVRRCIGSGSCRRVRAMHGMAFIQTLDYQCVMGRGPPSAIVMR